MRADNNYLQRNLKFYLCFYMSLIPLPKNWACDLNKLLGRKNNFSTMSHETHLGSSPDCGTLDPRVIEQRAGRLICPQVHASQTTNTT